jgi:hypothetical protein
MGSDQTEHDSPRIVRRSRNHVEHLLDGRADLVEIPGHIADPVDPIAEFAQLVLDDGEPTHDVIVDLHARFSETQWNAVTRSRCLSMLFIS